MKRRFSILIIPISILAHLLIINFVFYFYNQGFTDNSGQLIFINISWLLIAYFTKIYRFNRYIKVPKIVGRLFFQYSVFTLAFLSYYAIFDKLLNARYQAVYLLLIFVSITLFRAMYFYGLRRYRLEGYNFRNVVVIGSGKDVRPLVNFFNKRKDFGFHYKGFFDDRKESDIDYLGSTQESFDYIKNNEIDEIYCSISSLPKEKILEFIDFADDQVKTLKLIPDSNDLYSKMKLDYYGFVPVLSVRELPFDKPSVKLAKRVFDIVFSLFVIIFFLSWITPILYFLIKRESKGPLFFKQIREGIKGDTFMCYKYRSMGVNRIADKIQATKGDVRVTKIGKIIRKTSIDELPQFFNVLFGDMSVVGPRPHMLSQSEIFKKIVNKYMVRHFVKPGITGLAQVKGYRGEIETDKDIKNRVKYDIFYIENWSFFLDMKIIYQTVKNAIKGEDKAY
jgi:putative colanic acid biosynthesis UDP-glucose lipid carrier transferase